MPYNYLSAPDMHTPNITDRFDETNIGEGAIYPVGFYKFPPDDYTSFYVNLIVVNL